MAAVLSDETTADALLGAVRRDPPNAHPRAPRGVWSAALDCLEFLYERGTDAVTLETGCGASTIVLAAVAQRHTAVFLGPAEGEAVAGWCRNHGISTADLILLAGSSPEVLAALPREPLDMLFIDGCHAHPFPQLDWYLAAPRVRVGGLVVVDDIQLPAPASLHRFMRRDDRWDLVCDTGFWSAFRRVTDCDLSTEWLDQTPRVDVLDRLRHLGRTPRRAAALLRNARCAQRIGAAPWQLDRRVSATEPVSPST